MCLNIHVVAYRSPEPLKWAAAVSFHQLLCVYLSININFFSETTRTNLTNILLGLWILKKKIFNFYLPSEKLNVLTDYLGSLWLFHQTYEDFVIFELDTL